jgi:hypothetical protein
MPGLPAICDNGHRYEDRNIVVENSTDITVTNARVGPCPFCGAFASVVDGTYDVIGDVVIRKAVRSAVRTLTRPDVTVEELRALEAVLRRAQSGTVTADDVDTAAPSAGIGQWLKSPGGMATAAWLAVIVPALIGLITLIITLKSRGEAHPAVSPEQVERIIEQTVQQLRSTTPADSAPPPTTLPPRRQKGSERCACGSRRLYKNCHGRGRRRVG